MSIAASKTHQIAPPAGPSKPDRTLSRPRLEVVRNVTDTQVGHSLAAQSAQTDNTAAATAIAFGPFRLLRTKRLLLEGNEPVRIGSRALEILIALVEHHGELLSKSALMKRVWPDTTVVEANLSVHIAALRRALRDGSDGNRYLVNMPGRGYRFVAPIAVAGDEEPSTPIESATKPLDDLSKLLMPVTGRDETLKKLAELPEWRLLIVAAATLAAEILKGAPGVQALATGRESLRPVAAAPVLGLPTVQLFVERLRASLGEFEIKDAAALITADI